MTVIVGDSLEVLRGMPDASVDSIVTDPPYGISFMGKKWDYDVPSVECWAECLRVLKPGGHLLSFAGTRTQHRMAVRIEDAGFEIRDMIAWVYGSGFPKSLDVSKAIDKAAGIWRGRAGGVVSENGSMSAPNYARTNKGAPATDAARKWAGWGTALKPAMEPITVARKPFPGTVAVNVLAHGTGAINVDGCRVGTEGGTCRDGKANKPNDAGWENMRGHGIASLPQGRWPANLIHDGSDEVVGLFPMTTSGQLNAGHKQGAGSFGKIGGDTIIGNYGGDSGSAARFFYCSKASRQDRNSGLDSIEIVSVQCSSWENEDHKARLRVDTAQSPPRVIAVSGAPCNDAIAWSTFLFGNGTTDQPHSGNRFAIETATSSTTESKTLSWLIRSNTSESTAGASFATASGGSHAASAEANTPCLITTSGWTVSPRGVERAASPTRWTINGNAGQPSDHPTVKPTDLMRYLCRLVTPPGGIVLDPFAGSGTTGVAAKREGFDFIGIELNPEYADMARQRIAAVESLFAPSNGDSC